MKRLFCGFALAVLSCVSLNAQYQYTYYENYPLSNNAPTDANWTSLNGGISYISKVQVPSYNWPSGASNEYEVNTTLTLTTSGGYYQQYFRASNTAYYSNENGGTANGTFTLVQLTPTFSTLYGCSAILTQWDNTPALGLVQLSQATVPCYNNMSMRSVIYGNTISTLIDGQVYMSSTTNNGSGMPGYGLEMNPSGNGVTAALLGA